MCTAYLLKIYFLIKFLDFFVRSRKNMIVIKAKETTTLSTRLQSKNIMKPIIAKRKEKNNVKTLSVKTTADNFPILYFLSFKKAMIEKSPILPGTIKVTVLLIQKTL